MMTFQVVFARCLEGDWSRIFEVIGGLLVVIGGYWRSSVLLFTLGIVVFQRVLSPLKLRGA